MRVQVHPADEGGCGYYRLRWPVAVLAAAGADVVIGDTLRCERDSSPLLGDRPVRMMVDADVVVFQRPLRHDLVEIIPLLQRQGIAVVVEVDDNFEKLPKGHPARAHFSPARDPRHNWLQLREACRLADLVTVTTPALAAHYGAHGRCAILPNFVPERYLTIEREPHDGTVIGWTGTPATHLGDLAVMGNAVGHTLARHDDAKFRAIGSHATLRELAVPGEALEWCELTDESPAGYASQVAQLDVGLVPLVDSPFNDAKSALKMCEYAALGVPCVVSPSPENLRMAAQGFGLVASDAADWRYCLGLLAGSPAMREELAGEGRQRLNGWTYEANAWRWLEAWTAALAARRGVPVTA